MFLWNDRPKWEKAQAILHKKENGRFEMENTYGRLRYSKKNPDGKRGRPQKKKGFALEAKEAPGTLGHAEDEKRFKPDKMKKVSMKDERFLYAAGTPFKNQAVFYDISEYERSREFLDCMKRLIRERRHRTLQDTFGFLEHDSDRQLRQQLIRERKKDPVLQEFTALNHRIDKLSGHILKKEAKERQMQKDLQAMLDREKQKGGGKGKEKEKKDDRKQKVFIKLFSERFYNRKQKQSVSQEKTDQNEKGGSRRSE